MDFLPRRGKNDELQQYIVALVRAELAPLHGTVQRIVHELRAVQTSLVDLEHGLDARHDRLDALGERLARLEQELAAVGQQHDELDARFTKVLSAQAEAGATGASSRHVQHQEIADRYRTFVHQELTSAARAATAGHRRRRADDAESQAREAGKLSRAVFGGAEIDQRALGAVLAAAPEWATRLAVLGTELRMLAAAALPEGTWDFELRHRAALDQATQRPWGDYAPDAPPDFVVAPAYLADNLVFEPQRVATERHLKY
jgi:hypothetical protein